MRTSNLLYVCATVLCCARSLVVQAGGPYDTMPGYGYGQVRPMPVQRTMLGLPVPQQWSGARSGGYGRMVPVSGSCPNGQCANSCPNGQCGVTGSRYGGVMTGNCANGQCGTGNCANGQCNLRSGSMNGLSSCPNGQCFGNQMSRRPDYSMPSGWAPRSGSNSRAQSYGRTGDLGDDFGWERRPVSAPIRDAFGSRYQQRDLDLNSDYFGGVDEDNYDLRADDRVRRTEPAPYRSHRNPRSLEAPAGVSTGTSRI